LRPSGRVIEAKIGGVPLDGDSVSQGETARAGLLQGESAAVTAIVSSVADQSTNLLQVIDGSIEDVAVLSRVKSDATFYLRNRARSARLRELGVRLPGFFGRAGDDTVHVAGRLRNGSLTIGGRRGTDVRERTLRLTPRLAWALLFPTTRIGSESVVAGAMWLAALLVPFAYWSARAARLSGGHAMWWGIRAAIVIASLLGPALVLPIATSLWWEWGVAILTIAAGELAVASSVARWEPQSQRARSSFETS
jgi:hypothetical protein